MAADGHLVGTGHGHTAVLALRLLQGEREQKKVDCNFWQKCRQTFFVTTAMMLKATAVVAMTLTVVDDLCLLQVVQEYERAVIFRLGRLLSGGSRGPGE